jgi:hypothetical protein
MIRDELHVAHVSSRFCAALASLCSEGLLWHVMVNPIKISTSLLTKYLEAVGDRMCDMSPAVIQELAKADKYFKAPPVDKGEKKLGETC